MKRAQTCTTPYSYKKKFLQKHLAAFNALGDASCCLGSKFFSRKTLDGEVTLALEISMWSLCIIYLPYGLKYICRQKMSVSMEVI